jgi:hypothetical protein
VLRRKALKTVGGTAIGALFLSGAASADDSGRADPPKPERIVSRGAVVDPTDAVSPAPKEQQDVVYNPTSDDIINTDDPFPVGGEEKIVSSIRTSGGFGPDVVYVRGYVTYPFTSTQQDVTFDRLVQAPSDPGPLDIAEFNFTTGGALSGRPSTSIYKAAFRYRSDLPGQLEVDNTGVTLSNARDRSQPRIRP